MTFPLFENFLKIHPSWQKEASPNLGPIREVKLSLLISCTGNETCYLEKGSWAANSSFVCNDPDIRWNFYNRWLEDDLQS